jgi:hypothetical protein
MTNYKLIKDLYSHQIKKDCIHRLSDNGFIPSDPANMDYARFKKEILADQAQLQDADGNLMSASAAKAFVATLP